MLGREITGDIPKIIANHARLYEGDLVWSAADVQEDDHRHSLLKEVDGLLPSLRSCCRRFRERWNA